MIWCIYCKDKSDSLEVRKANRQAHIDYLGENEVLVAGPLLDDDGDMMGSCILLEAPDRAAVEAFATNDPYAQAGLFADVTITGFAKGFWPT